MLGRDYQGRLKTGRIAARLDPVVQVFKARYEQETTLKLGLAGRTLYALDTGFS